MTSIQQQLHAEKLSSLHDQIIDLNEQLELVTAERDEALLQLAARDL